MVPLTPTIRSIEVNPKDKLQFAIIDFGLRYVCPVRQASVRIIGSARYPTVGTKYVPNQKPIENFIVPYWCVKVAGDQAKANMVIVTRTVDGNIKVPMLKNCVALKQGDECCVYIDNDMGSTTPQGVKGKGKGKLKGKPVPCSKDGDAPHVNIEPASKRARTTGEAGTGHVAKPKMKLRRSMKR